MNLSEITYFPLLSAENISVTLFYKNDFIDLLQNLLPLSSHILFGLRFDSSKIFLKALVIATPFSSFKG